MDREDLIQRLVAFVRAAGEEGRPVNIVRLDDAIPGVPTGQFIVRLAAPWAQGISFTEALRPLIKVLFGATDAATRNAIAALDIRPSAAEIITPAQAQAVWANG